MKFLQFLGLSTVEWNDQTAQMVVLSESVLRRFFQFLLLAILLAMGPAATAQEFTSRYSSIKQKQCKPVKSREIDSASWTCPGVAGYVVAVSEEDVRQSVSVARTRAAADKEPAAATFFGPPNFAHDTIEWRIPSGTDRPIAIIQRWTLIPDEQPRRSILVVTRLPPGPVCHVAYVSVAENKDANAIARKAADELARTFDCKNDATILGERGPAIPVSRP